MNRADVERRFAEALASPNRAQTLHALAESHRDAGMPQPELYALFERHRAGRDTIADEATHDAILDVMDRIVGWCSPHLRLYEDHVAADPMHVVRTFATPFYLRILHGNYAHLLLAEEDSPERREFIRRARAAVATVSPAVVDLLFAELNWRWRLVAAWYCGVKGWRQYADRVGGLLVPSRQCFAGQAYCFALACFADDASAAHLCRYLDEYLPRPDLEYDQVWAMPALLWIDRRRGTDVAGRYVRPGGLWEQFIGRKEFGGQTLDECRQRFDTLMEVTRSTFGIG